MESINLTKEKLLEYKAQGMTDEKLCNEVLFISNSTLQRLKKELGAVRVRTPFNIVKKHYAIYKDEEFIFMGTADECAEYLGVKPQSFRVKVHKTKLGEQKQKYTAFVIEKE